MTRPPLPHHAEPERVVDEWSSGGLQFRLMLMGLSDRRKHERAKRKALKQARMKGERPKSESTYALKRRGIYPRNSPYLTGFWGVRMKKLGAVHG